MTSTTLIKTDSDVIDATGSGTITLRPDVGQNWAPLFVRTSASDSNTHCAVYHGSPGVPVQLSQFIDDTVLGSDSSSMIAGTPVLYGEAVIFQYSNGTPGDTVTATVYGQTSDLPPNLDLVPQVPGTHFTGHITPESTITVFSSGASFGSSLAGGVTLLYPLGLGTKFDTSAYGSISIALNARCHTFAGAPNVPVQVTLIWSSTNGSVVYQDTYEFWADGSGNGSFSGGTVSIQDVAHGPRLQIQLANNSGATLIDYDLTVIGTTRVLPGPYVRQANGIDSILVDTLANLVGGAATVLLQLAYGGIELLLFNNDPVNTMTFYLGYGSKAHGTGTNTDFLTSLAANGGLRIPNNQIILPKRAGILTLMGTGTAQYGVKAIANFERV